jgi:hypothetical protein
MSFTEYEISVIQKLNKCEQFEGWSFDDLKEFIYEEFKYDDDLKRFYNEGKTIDEATDILDAGTWIFM